MLGAPPFVDYLLVKIAMPGFEALMPVFGISDWIIIAFLSAATCKFNMNDNLIGKSISEIKKTSVFFSPNWFCRVACIHLDCPSS